MPRFETTTKTIIETPNGKILKITTYSPGFDPFVEYKIKPKCHICNENVDCICFNFENEENPLHEAIQSLEMKNWVCDKYECIFEHLKNVNSIEFKELYKKYNGNPEDIVEYYLDSCDFDDDLNRCEL